MIPAFKNLENREILPIGYQRVNFHMIFDVNIEGFRRKDRLLAGLHMMEPPVTITYVSVVSREIVRIDPTLDALNDFPVKVADIQNDYTTSPVSEKIWKVLGQAFGENYGRKATVVQSLYGLKSAGSAFRNHLADCIHNLGLLTCTSNLDL